MSLFDNYENLDTNYIPNNSDDPKLNEKVYTIDTLPKHLYNVKGELVGLSWKQGENVSINISVDHALYVESDAIILYTSGKTPISDLSPEQKLKAKYGIRCYNTKDAKSWTCISLDSSEKQWLPDPVLTTQTRGKLEIFTNQEFSDTSAINFEVCLFNFRYEKIDTFVPNNSGRSFDLAISADKSQSYLPGTYKLVATATQGSVTRVVYEQFIIICQGEYNV